MDDKSLLIKYRKEIQELKSKLINQISNADQSEEIRQLQDEKKRVQDNLAEQQLLKTSMQERIQNLTDMILTSNSASGMHAETTKSKTVNGHFTL